MAEGKRRPFTKHTAKSHPRFTTITAARDNKHITPFKPFPAWPALTRRNINYWQLLEQAKSHKFPRELKKPQTPCTFLGCAPLKPKSVTWRT